MRARTAAVGAVLVIALLSPGLAGCRQKLVEVQTGTQVFCTYGELVSSDVDTVRVPANEAAKYSVTAKTITCERHRKLSSLYDEAQKALASRETSTARKKLGEVAKIDPAYRKTAEQIKAIDSGKKPAPDTSPEPALPPEGGGAAGPGSPGEGSGEEPEAVGPAVNLLGYVPDEIPGYTAKAVIADPLNLSRTYVPTSKTAVTQLVIAAEQFKDGDQAEKVIASNWQRYYSSSSSAVRVAGKSGYFGTDGRMFAIIAIRDGAVVVVFEMASAVRRPAELKDELVSVASVVF